MKNAQQKKKLLQTIRSIRSLINLNVVRTNYNLTYLSQNNMMHTVPVIRAIYDHLGTKKDLEHVLGVLTLYQCRERDMYYMPHNLPTKVPAELYYLAYFTYN